MMTVSAPTSRCQEITKRLEKLLPGGVNSPVRNLKAVGGKPLIVSKGKGDTIWDVDGREFVDYCGSWGALIHGHAHPSIVSKVQETTANGTSFGITAPSEEALAQRVVRLVPSLEKVRFVCSGTEATMTALRLARGYTGKELIVKFVGNYHGHADFLLVQAGSGVMGLNATSSSAGVPEAAVADTACLRYNDVEGCKAFLRQPEVRERLAAVIIEPIAGNMGVVPATPEFLQMLRDETRSSGALLILDEVITGFRVGLHGAQHLYNVDPDITCLGKVVAGGMPAAAFGGRAEIMDHLAPLGSVYQAGTLAGNPLAMVAGDEALRMLEEPGVYEELQRKTDLITVPLREAIARHEVNACVQQVGSMFTVFFGKRKVVSGEDAQNIDTKVFGEFFRYLFERGVYISPSAFETCFVSLAHTDNHLERTRDLMVDFVALIAAN